MKSSRGFSTSVTMLAVLVISIIVFGGYYVFSQQTAQNLPETQKNSQDLETDNKSIENERPEAASSEEQTQEVEITEQDINDGKIYTSQIRKENNQILFDFYVGPGFSQVWVEYGVEPNNLTEYTDKNSDGLGMVFPGDLGGLTAVIDTNELPSNPESVYFYRAAGVFDGKTLYGGVSTFNHK